MNKKVLAVGCIIFLLIGLLLFCFLGGGAAFLSNLIGNSREVIEYNNKLVDYRNKIVVESEKLQTAYRSALELSEISSALDSYNEVLDDVSTSINNESVSTKGQPLKDLNIKYIEKAREIADVVEGSTKDAKTVYDISDEDINNFNNKIKELDQINVDIAKKLNELAGFEAISKKDIDELETQLREE